MKKKCASSWLFTKIISKRLGASIFRTDDSWINLINPAVNYSAQGSFIKCETGVSVAASINTPTALRGITSCSVARWYHAEDVGSRPLRCVGTTPTEMNTRLQPTGPQP